MEGNAEREDHIYKDRTGKTEKRDVLEASEGEKENDQSSWVICRKEVIKETR